MWWSCSRWLRIVLDTKKGLDGLVRTQAPREQSRPIGFEKSLCLEKKLVLVLKKSVYLLVFALIKIYWSSCLKKSAYWSWRWDKNIWSWSWEKVSFMVLEEVSLIMVCLGLATVLKKSSGLGLEKKSWSWSSKFTSLVLVLRKSLGHGLGKSKLNYWSVFWSCKGLEKMSQSWTWDKVLFASLW